MGLEGDTVVVESGGDKEDGALVLSQLGETGLDGVVGSKQIDGDDGLEGVGRQVVEVGQEVAGSTTDDKVDSAELLDGSLSSRNQRLDLSDVGVSNTNDLGAGSQLGHLVGGLLCNLGSSSDDGGVSTQQNHGLSLHSANGACTSGHEDNLALEDVGLENGLLEPIGRQCVGHCGEMECAVVTLKVSVTVSKYGDKNRYIHAVTRANLMWACTPNEPRPNLTPDSHGGGEGGGGFGGRRER